MFFNFFNFLLSISMLDEINVYEKCLRCICEQESGCRRIGCKMDRGSLSCGYYQIKLPYYKDCGEPDKRVNESTEDAWKRCSDDLKCATTCVLEYSYKYEPRCKEKTICEAVARLHNGGPNGCSKSSTIPYWNRVREKTN